jgi:hypothetical protein
MRVAAGAVFKAALNCEIFDNRVRISSSFLVQLMTELRFHVMPIPLPPGGPARCQVALLLKNARIQRRKVSPVNIIVLF